MLITMWWIRLLIILLTYLTGDLGLSDIKYGNLDLRKHITVMEDCRVLRDHDYSRGTYYANTWYTIG